MRGDELTMKPLRINPCRLGPLVYETLQRMFRCERCGAQANAPCLGARGIIIACHLDRKRRVRDWRRGDPNGYRAMRDAVARQLAKEYNVPPPRWVKL